MIMISACLAGKKCRYDGKAKENAMIKEIIASGEEYVLFCPECAAGLEIPRTPCEIVGGEGKDVLNGNARIMSCDGLDRTDAFIKGAYRTLEQAEKLQPRKIYLKAKSPSCGVGQIYDGTFKGMLTNGNGVTAELLIQKNFEVEVL